MIFVLNHFWSHVLQGTAESVPLLHMVGLDAPPKIADFNDITIFNQDVLGLDISVNQTLFVHVIDAAADLYEEVEGSVLTQKLFFPNQIKQVTFTCIL